MLKTSDNFSANEIRFLQNEATQFIQDTNAQIIEAAKIGKSEIRVLKWDDKTQRYFTWTVAQLAIMAHFEHRGFTVIMEGMGSMTISWQEK